MKSIYFFVLLLAIPMLSVAQDASDISAMDTDIAGAKTAAKQIARGLFAIGACIGLVSIARKTNTEGANATGEIVKYLLLLTVSIAGFVATSLLFGGG